MVAVSAISSPGLKIHSIAFAARERKHLTNATEALCRTNDFHPFVEGELIRVDPRGVKLMKETWFGIKLRK
jgi:hypothetical protein